VVNGGRLTDDDVAGGDSDAGVSNLVPRWLPGRQERAREVVFAAEKKLPGLGLISPKGSGLVSWY